MFYLKLTAFEGVFQLPVNTPLFQNKIEKMIEQREKININYILGGDLGDVFYSDLDVNGDPQSARFVNINNKLKYSVLRYTFVEVFNLLRTLNSPLGTVTPTVAEAQNYPYFQIAILIDEAAEMGRELRKYIFSNGSIYPEYCPACISPLRKSII
jgi:hypothetical protein